MLLYSVCEHTAVSEAKFFFFLLFLSQCACSAERKTNKSLGTLGFAQGERYYLRYPLWRDKAGGLDRWQARSWKHVYQLDFHPCRDNFLGSSENETHTFWLDALPRKSGASNVVIFPTFCRRIFWNRRLQKHKCQVNKMTFKAEEGCHKELIKERRAVE